MEENRRGFHHRESQGHDHNTGRQGRIEPPAAGRAGMKEPSNHAGHTYDGKHNAAHAARVSAMRTHAGAGQADHERILHDTHKLHQSDGHFSHGNKHGESHHIREGGVLRPSETGKELD